MCDPPVDASGPGRGQETEQEIPSSSRLATTAPRAARAFRPATPIVIVASLVLGLGLLSLPPAWSLAGPTQYWVADGPAFQPTMAETEYRYVPSGCLSRTSGPNTFTLDVQLPEGALIEHLTLRSTDVQPGDIVLTLFEYDGQGSAWSLAEVRSAAGPKSVDLQYRVDPSSRALGLEAKLESTGPFLQLCGVEIRYQLADDLPVAVSRHLFVAGANLRPGGNGRWAAGGAAARGCVRASEASNNLFQPTYDLELPDGATIDQVEFFFFDNDVRRSAMFEVWSRRISDGDLERLFRLTTPFESSGFGSIVATPDHDVDNNARALNTWAYLSPESGPLVMLCGLRVTYRVSGEPPPEVVPERVGGSAFWKRWSTEPIYLFFGCAKSGSSTERLSASIHLPQGVVVESMRVYYDQDDRDQQMTFSLIAFGQSGASNILTLLSEGRPFVDSPPFRHEVANDREALSLVVDGTTSRNKICRVELRYRGLPPGRVFSDSFERADLRAWSDFSSQ